MNALRLPILIILPLLLSGCASLNLFGEDVKPVEVVTKEIERTPLNLRDPKPIKMQDVTWVVVTPENIDEVWAKLEESGTDQVLFGLTDEGYESLAINMANIRNLVNEQRIIIMKYKEYYEPAPVEK